MEKENQIVRLSQNEIKSVNDALKFSQTLEETDELSVVFTGYKPIINRYISKRPVKKRQHSESKFKKYYYQTMTCIRSFINRFFYNRKIKIDNDLKNCIFVNKPRKKVIQ